MHDVATSLMD